MDLAHVSFYYMIHRYSYVQWELRKLRLIIKSWTRNILFFYFVKLMANISVLFYSCLIVLKSKKEWELKRTLLLLLLNKSIVRRIAARKPRRGRRTARPHHQVAWPRRTTAAAGAPREQALRRTAAQESWRRRRGRALRNNGALLGDRAPPLGRGRRRRGREVRHRGPVPEDELIKEPAIAEKTAA